MANFKKKKIQDTEDSNFGNYSEDIGGGASPHPKVDGSHGHGANSEYRESNNDTMQPRTDDGKFTYKSANGKSINPKYGPSRGKTVNPLLTGGKNGIKISDVESQFANESGKYWDKYKDKWYRKGGLVVTTDLKTRVAKKAIWNVAREIYNVEAGEFGGTFKDEDGNVLVKQTPESEVFDETKKGRQSKEMKAAIQKVQATGEETPVLDQKSGGIKLKPGVVQPQPKAAPAPVQPKAQPTPAAPTPAPQPKPTLGTLKHSAEELNELRQALVAAGYGDFSSATDEQLDQDWDKYVDTDDQQNEIPEEDDETTKKIKAMGFSE